LYHQMLNLRTLKHGMAKPTAPRRLHLPWTFSALGAHKSLVQRTKFCTMSPNIFLGPRQGTWLTSPFRHLDFWGFPRFLKMCTFLFYAIKLLYLLPNSLWYCIVLLTFHSLWLLTNAVSTTEVIYYYMRIDHA